MSSTKETVVPSGLNIWSSEAADGLAPAVDIIAVQGLGSHELYTWLKKVPSGDADKSERFRDTAKLWKGKKQQGKAREDDPKEVMWIWDLLVPLFKNARIATYSYKSDWSDRGVKTSLRQCAEQFLTILSHHRQQADQRRRPLVLIGHSLGSIVIQQAFVIAAHERIFTDLRLSVAGVIFLGAPFHGSNARIFGGWPAQPLELDSNFLQALEKESLSLYTLSTDFWGKYFDCDSVVFFGKREVDYRILKTQVVNTGSASLSGAKRMISLNTNHSGLNKFNGENDENFNLFLAEIRRMVENGPSIVAKRYRVEEINTTAYRNTHWMIPHAPSHLFTGRSELLCRIKQAISYNQTSPSDKQRRFVITGFGGQGKSEICLQIANQMREEFWGIFWVDVSNAFTAERDFITIAKILTHSPKDTSIYDATQVLASIEQPWLLILDGADNLNFDYRVYFPSGTYGSILMTSRVLEYKQYSPDANEVLEGLEKEESRELLLKAADIPRELWLSYYSQVDEVVQLLGSHTLALIQAGRYIMSGHCELHQYTKLYQRQRELLLKYFPTRLLSKYRDIYATFEASAKVLEQSKSEVAKDALCLLEVLSMLDSTVVPLQIFHSAWDGSKEILRTSYEEASGIDTIFRINISCLPSFIAVEDKEWDSFRLLEASSLLASLSIAALNYEDSYPGLSMHPLIHAWAKERQNLEQQSRSWLATGCILALSRTDSKLWQAQERLLLLHMQSYLDIWVEGALSFGSKRLVISILIKCGWTLLDMRQDLKLSDLLGDIFFKLGKNPYETSKEYLSLYDLQARSLLNLGRVQEAIAILELVIKIRKTTLAPDHPDRLTSQNALAIAYEANGQVTEASDEQTVKIEEREVANSDSGYASGTREQSNKTYKFSESKLLRVAEVSEFQENVELDCVAGVSDSPNIGLYDKDTTYSPSETPSLPALRSRAYIDDLASQLFRTVASQKPDQETLNRVSRELPDLLRVFSLKIGYRANPSQCHVAYFVHKYRGYIQQSFEDMFLLEPLSKVNDFDSTDTGGYKIRRFFEGLGLTVDPPQEEDSKYEDLPPTTADQASTAGIDHDRDAEDEAEPLEPMPYRDSVLSSPAFDWLIASLLTEVNLTRQEADVMRSIRSQILGTLPSSHEVSRKKSSKEYRAIFEIDWDPLSFVKDQKYQESPDQAIERSITLTGSPMDAQALTAGQYLAQTWPASGAEVMRIVAEVMRNTDHYASGTLPDGTELQTRIDGGKFTVHATGIGDSLAEVAQQFAWLGAALRPSPFESGIAMCSPAIRNPSLKNITPQGKSPNSETYAEFSCIIEFDIQEPLSGAQRGAGHCWHSMFRNPVMVKGYPIMAKYKSGLGLEVPLNIIAWLAGSNHANEFDGKTFIKGFSAMLIATEASKDLLLWHYYFNATGERISYLDHDLEIVEAVSLQQLGAARHVVGWCRECNSYAGAANIPYGEIGSVYLPEPHADCILEKISLSGGHLVSGGISFAAGVQHIPPHLTRNSYLGKLAWIATRFVVFWDERDKRGWLANGTSALLHLVNASIQHHKRGDFSALVTFDPSQIKSPAECKPNYASQVLSNPENLEVEVQLDKVEKTDEYDPAQDVDNASAPKNRKPKIKRTYKLFSDVVEEHYRHLEQIMDYQVQAGGQNGVKIKLRFRDHLEGWDFMELATGHDPSPRLATLDKLGYGWVNLVRSIEAITLIGSGFGEMIRPIEFDGMCPNWKTLPPQRYYLAATIFDLKKIIMTKKFGGSLEKPIKPVRDLLWHSPQETVAPCPCRSETGPQENPAGVSHHDPVQVFYSTTWKSILRINGPELHSEGAIVFGHPMKGKFCWKKQGDEHAEQSEPPMSLKVTCETESTAARAQSRASSGTSPAQDAYSNSQSSSGVTRYSSASTSATVSTPIESATASGGLTTSTSSENLSDTLTSAEQIPLDGIPREEIQKTRKSEKKKSLLRKIFERRKKPI